MAGISRRKFLIGTGAGAATVGALAVAPSLSGRAGAAERPDAGRQAAPVGAQTTSSTDAVVVHIPDPRTGEIRYMFGTREIVQQDKALVARLLRDVR
jgi:metal-dependent amidase/aminoacylase/carboxypeptidase family protein